MKRGYLFCIVMMICALLAPAAAGVELPTVFSECFVVMDAGTGQILAQKNGDLQKYPASITKILTVGMILERHSLEDRVKVEEEAVQLMAGAAAVGLIPGERLTVRDLVYATMVASANDAANALALYNAGNLVEFSRRMNEKARECGAHNSQFVNPSGLYDPNHYSTAADMARITRWAMGVRLFPEVAGKREYVVSQNEVSKTRRVITSQHQLLAGNAMAYEGVLAGKLGWTPESRHTAVTVAERDGMQLICVVLDSGERQEKFLDTTALLDYGFSTFTRTSVPVPQDLFPETVPLGEGGIVRFTVPEAVEVTLAVGDTLENLELTHNLPDAYRDAQQVEPVLTLKRKQSGEVLLEWPLYYTIDSTNLRSGTMVQLENSFLDALGRFWTLPVPVRVLSIAGGSAVLMLVGAVLYRYFYRRRQRKLLLEHLYQSLNS